jgi:hypothetical protein
MLYAKHACAAANCASVRRHRLGHCRAQRRNTAKHAVDYARSDTREARLAGRRSGSNDVYATSVAHSRPDSLALYSAGVRLGRRRPWSMITGKMSGSKSTRSGGRPRIRQCEDNDKKRASLRLTENSPRGDVTAETVGRDQPRIDRDNPSRWRYPGVRSWHG